MFIIVVASDGLLHAVQVLLDLILDLGDFLIECSRVLLERLPRRVHRCRVLLDGRHRLVLSRLALDLENNLSLDHLPILMPMMCF